MEGVIYRGKFAFQNRFGYPYSWKEIYRFCFVYFVFEGNFQVQAPRGAYIWRSYLTEGFWRYEFGGLIFGGAYLSEFYGIYTTGVVISHSGDSYHDIIIVIH